MFLFGTVLRLFTYEFSTKTKRPSFLYIRFIKQIFKKFRNFSHNFGSCLCRGLRVHLGTFCLPTFISSVVVRT